MAVQKKDRLMDVNKGKTPEQIHEEKKTKLLKKVLNILKKDNGDGNKNEILYVSDLIARSGVATSTFYEYFPSASKEMELIKEEIEKTRIFIKSGLRKKMYQSKNSLGHIALYKLIGTDEERAILNQQDVRLSGNVDTKVTQTVVFKTRERKKEE